MKKVILFLLAATWAIIGWAQIPPPPDPPRLVNDFAGVLTSQQVNELEYRLVAFNDSTSNVICVVIVNDLGGYEAAEFAYEIGDKWGVKDKSYNNGVVILIKPSSPKGGDGDIFIATGYDLEGVLPDAACKRIINEQFIPELTQGHYYEAIVKGLDVILPVVAGEISVVRDVDGNDVIYILLMIFFIIVSVVILSIANNNSEKGNKGGGSGDQRDDALDAAAKAALWAALLGSGGRHGRSGYGGGSFGGGFGGGGFGGFGGSGGFGGGGAGGKF